MKLDVQTNPPGLINIRDMDGSISEIPDSSSFVIDDGSAWLKRHKCECGAEAVGASKHSSWCDLYE